MKYAVTAASGQLGRLAIEALLKRLPPDRIVAAVRNPEKVADLRQRGVEVRVADYDRPETLTAAFAGVERLLLISSSELGKRAVQHRAAIDAARSHGPRLVAYTSLLHADSSPLGLAEEHRQTEAALRESGLPHVLLRNGWYSENHLMGLRPALAHGAMLGAAQDGRIASAARADFAEAAAIVLTGEAQAGRVYELAGDTSWTLSELAGEITRQSGTTVAYRDLPQADYAAALAGAGFPQAIADLLADSDACAARGALDDTSRDLSRLIGRPTTPLAESVAAALSGETDRGRAASNT